MTTADKIYWTISVAAIAILAIWFVIAKLWFDD